ncbi:MAG TPA: L-dopachrome tautomerase-related protein [Abditibacteriaceae bacterium]
MKKSVFITGALLGVGLLQSPQEAQSRRVPQGYQTVARFYGAMPTGVTVSHKGRIFVNFPRWGDRVRYTVAEVKKGRMVPFPSASISSPTSKLPRNRRLVSVQSVVVDPKDRLWMLDTGSVKLGPTMPGGPKLMGVDLKTNRVFKTISFPPKVALKTTYLNDIRFDLRRGKGGMAFITDSSGKGPNGIIVVDLATGQSWRRLHDHPSTKAENNFVPYVEGPPKWPLMVRKPGQDPKALSIGADGIAISADGERLFYCPLASRKLYSVSVDALANRAVNDTQVGETVKTEMTRPGAADGLESDAQGRIYATDYENARVIRWNNGQWQTVMQAPKIYWPDTLSLGRNGYLYCMANQLHRQADYHKGQDIRRKVYELGRIYVGALPVLLK